MLETLYSPDAIHEVGTTFPGVPRPGPSWGARLRGLVTALESRVPGAAAHARRVAAQSRLVAERLGIDQVEVARIECAGHVHDVGKIIVSPEILEKPGSLTPLEFAEVQRHAVFGARLVASLDDPAMTAIVRHHHERLDGSGYPDRLRGLEIPIGSRIIGVVDSYDALTSCRPYREAATPSAAIEILEEEAGITLDADIVAAFIS
jgi:HD-GYP domain-containing protein (c-di-GMP phosphodiesterase class II)